MKKYLLLVLLLSAITVHAQINKVDLPKMTKIGEFKSNGIPIVTLSFSVSSSDTTYYWQYKNQKYELLTDYRTITFEETGGVLNDLYTIFKSSISEAKEATFKLGEATISLEPGKALGVKYVTAYVLNNGGNFRIGQKQLDKIFNRK